MNDSLLLIFPLMVGLLIITQWLEEKAIQEAHDEANN